MTQKPAHAIKNVKILLLTTLNSHLLKVNQAMKPLSRSSKMKQILQKSALWQNGVVLNGGKNIREKTKLLQKLSYFIVSQNEN